MTSPEAFVAALDADLRVRLDALGARSCAGDPTPLEIPKLLVLALRNELEASELAAHWMVSTPELDAKLALARQCGDEAKHFRWVEARLAELGVTDLPPPAPPTPLLTFLKSLETTVERAAAGQFTREAIAVVRNDVFVSFCETRGDHATAALYRDRINPDERHHHELGRALLLAYATTGEAQTRARAAATKTLEIADELQDLARLKLGVSRAPGC